jgi:hypothetical protein
MKRIPHDPCHLGVPLGSSKMISEHMVHSTQTMHLSCVKISTISKRTKLFHLNHVTSDYHWERPKWFLSRWYVWRKVCTYLAPRLTLSPNEKRDTTWPASPRSSIGCIQNNFWAYGMFDANRASILHHDYYYIQMDRAFTWASSPRSSIGCI